MSLDYAIEKYFTALDSLVSTGSVQERLTFAADSLRRLQQDQHFPTKPDLVGRHAAIMKKLTTTPFTDANGYQPRKLTDDEARDLSREILSVFVELKGGL